jgi:DNA-binding GntR family transcriptional regulator
MGIVMQAAAEVNNRKQLSEEVSAYVREAIMAGELRPGESVRAEILADTLAVSATPVREALHALRVEGFLDLVPRKGFTVTRLVGDDIRDIFRGHALIAGELAARAALMATPKQISELEALHFELMAAAHRDDTELLERKNHEFHREVNRIAGAPRLRWVLGIFSRYVPRRFYSQIPGWPATTAEDHAAVLAAIIERDADEARAAMEKHIANSGELLAQHFDRRLSEIAESSEV